MAWMRGKVLGAGAFGSVNLAIRREDGGVFAVKSVVVREATEVAVRAIENEIGLLQELESRYVVRCLGSDWSEEGGKLMRNLFLEYMPEGCMTDFVRQFGSLDEHLLRTYTRSIVEGIDYLHGRGIVHCDVKGKNILVGNGNVKLTDFGSAKRLGEEVAEVVNCAKVNGTPLWMAPEVVRQVEQGPASDIWSLGCTVVEMATGRAPWSNLAGMNHFVALYHIGCTDELPPVPATLSEDAHDFLSHCFERDPRRRWTSAQLLQHPFLTTRFAPSMKPPASPVSVMDFPAADSDSDLSASFANSVPTLAAAPSLLKRGLVSKVEQAHAEENWWRTPAGPDSGPWIVVRSPKSSSSPPSFASPDSPRESSISAVSNPNTDCEEIFVEPITAAPFLTVSSSLVETSSSEADDAAAISSPLVQTATGFDFCHFAISEVSSCVRFRDGVVAEAAGDYARLLKSLENLHFFANLAPDEEDPRASLNLGLAALIGTINEYSELVYQYSNPQILLYWWHSHRKRLQSSGSDSEKYCKCILQFLDESTLLETTSPLSSHIHSSLSVFGFVCVFFLGYGVCVFDGRALVGELF
jgi:serine/threonine protein kinase